MINEDKEDEASEPTQEVTESPIVVPAVIVPVVVPVEIKRITFKQFIAGKANIKPQHLSGLKAFIGNFDKLRTEDEWNTLLSGY